MQGRRALARSKGISRVPLDDLGPALFNRGGAPTSGRHCVNLAKRILMIEGFATYRYVAGFAHEPDPADPNAVANHGNRMAERDALLPRLPAKSLKGVFAKTHLVTLLQLYKGGHLPDLVAWVATHRSSEEREELEDVLRYGIFMHVFPWEAVRDHPEDMKALMASDNFDHGHGLTDSELRCINGMREAILKLEVPRASSQGSASSQYDVVMAHVQRMSGQRWHEKDLECFWNFAQTTLDVHLAMLVEVWSFGECEDILQVDSAFFGALAKVSAKNQWSRCALAVRQFLSDKETECILVGGRYVAGAVDKNTLKRLAASNRNDKQKASSQELESFLGAIMQQYYLPWSNDWMRSPFQRDAWAKAFAAFLCKMGNLICRDTPPDHASKLKMETKLRETLNRDKLSEMPSRVVPDGVAPSVPNREGETVKAQDDLGSQASISSKRMAAECGLAMNGGVILKKTKRDANIATETMHVGIVQSILDQGVEVKWKDGQVTMHTQADLMPAPKQKASSQEPASLTLAACKWAACSTEDNMKMWMQLTQTTLYQLYVSQSAAHNDLRVTITPTEAVAMDGIVRVYAARDFKPKTLVLLPFSTSIIGSDQARPKDAVPVTMIVYPEKEEKSSMTFWMRMRALPKSLASSQDRAVVLIPFWALAARPHKPVSGQDQNEDESNLHVLVYRKVTVDIPTPAAVTKGVRVQKPKIQLCVPCMTNTNAITKGSRLMIAGKVPAGLETLCPVIEEE